MKKILSCTFAALLVSAVFAYGTGAPKSVTVYGTGIVPIAPDRASIDLSVVTRNKAASEASQENAALMATVQKAVSFFLKEGDTIHTSNYSVFQETSYQNGVSTPGLYRVSNDLTITVRQMDSVSAIIDAAISAGANQLSNLRFTATNTEAAVQKARELAVENARSAAQTLAAAAGAKMGKVLYLQETSGAQPRMAEGQNLMMKSAAMRDSTPIMPGDSDVRVTITATWELK